MTLIAASIAVHDAVEVEGALERAAAAVRAGARIVEWRIDALAGQANVLAATVNLIRGSPAPCIVTCRPSWEGGEYSGDEPARANLFEALIGGDDRPRYIDLELAALQRDPDLWRGVRHTLEQATPAPGLATSLILSVHDFDGRPRDLLRRVNDMANDPACAVIKLAWQARSLRDNLEAFDLLQARHKPMIALCMGQFGLLSRVMAPKFGAFLTFATDQEGQITAPGQPTIDELRTLYQFDRIQSQARVYGVIGWPVTHSLSPRIHNAGFEAVGHEGVYLALPVPPEYEHFKATVGSLIDHAGLIFRGASVTIPHKENLLRFVRERGGRTDELTEMIGAANTLVVGSAGGLECCNTDCPAAMASLCDGLGIAERQLANKRVAVLGAGGVARAVVAGLLRAGAAVVIFNRTAERAVRLAEDLNAALRPAASGVGSATAVSTGRVQDLARGGFDIYINCTPLGMAGAEGGAADESPLPPETPLDEHVTVFDTVYTPLGARTPLIKQAEARGARAIPGVDMFIRQAALQFERWTGVPAPLATFKTVLAETQQR